MTAVAPSAGPGLGRLVTSATLFALWLGAAVLTAAVVAPAAFAVLPTRALAGALVGRVLPIIFVTGIVVGAAGALLARGSGGAFARARTALPVACALFCAAAQFAVTPRIETLRARMGPEIEALPRDDARRVEFGRLHGISVLLMGVAGLTAGAALVLTGVVISRDS